MKKITLTFAALAAFTMAPVSFAHRIDDIGNSIFDDTNQWIGDNVEFYDDPSWNLGVMPGMLDSVANTAGDILHIANTRLNIPNGYEWSVDWINLGYVRASESDTGSARIIQDGSDVYANGYVRIGENPGSHGTYEINGGSLTLRGTTNADGPLQVGFNGTGVLKINGGEINCAYGAPDTWYPGFRVGEWNQSGAVTVHDTNHGEVIQKGGRVNVSRLLVAPSGGRGKYTMSGGVIDTSSWLVVGGWGDADGTFIMTGGTVYVGWNWLPYGGNISRHYDLKDHRNYAATTNGHNSGSNNNVGTTVWPNGSTSNGTYLLVGGVSRNNYYGSTGETAGPDGRMTLSGGEMFVQGAILVGYGARNSTPTPGTEAASRLDAPAKGDLIIGGNAEMTLIGRMYIGRNAGIGTLTIEDNAHIIMTLDFWAGASEPTTARMNNEPTRNPSISTKGTVTQTGGIFEIRDTIKLGEGTRDEVITSYGKWEISGGELKIGQMGICHDPEHTIVSESDSRNNDLPNIGRLFLGLYGKGEMIVSGNAYVHNIRTEPLFADQPTSDACFIIGNNHGDPGSLPATGVVNQGIGIFEQKGGLVDKSGVITALGRSGGDGTYNMRKGTAKLREIFLCFTKANTITDGVITAWTEGNHTGAKATLNLYGGVMEANFISKQVQSTDTLAKATINFAGGTLKAREDTPEIFITDKVDEIKVSADSYIDTSGRNFTIAAKLTGTGNLIILGDGEVTFTGDKAGFSGAIIIDGEPSNPTGNFNSWAKDEFSDEELADSAISGPEADPQNIGVPNLLRYALGLGRNESPVGALPTLTKNDTAGTFGALSSGNSYTFSYRYDATKEDISYIVETSTDLKNWETVDTEPTIDEENGTASVVISADGAVRKFFRLKIVQK